MNIETSHNLTLTYPGVLMLMNIINHPVEVNRVRIINQILDIVCLLANYFTLDQSSPSINTTNSSLQLPDEVQ